MNRVNDITSVLLVKRNGMVLLLGYLLTVASGKDALMGYSTSSYLLLLSGKME